MIMDVKGVWLIGGIEGDQEPKVTPRVIKDDTPGTYQGKTAAQWREMERDCYRLEHESFERSDTDGALSQWANATMARKYQLCASVAERNGMWTFEALFDLDGNLIKDAVWIKTKFSKWVWRIGTGDAVRWFTPSQARSGARRRAFDESRGYRVGSVERPAVVCSGSSGRGLSGSVYYYVNPVRDSPAKVLDNGTGPLAYENR